jgi:hypothetical protein
MIDKYELTYGYTGLVRTSDDFYAVLTVIVLNYT